MQVVRRTTFFINGVSENIFWNKYADSIRVKEFSPPPLQVISTVSLIGRLATGTQLPPCRF